MKIFIISFTGRGAFLAEQVKNKLQSAELEITTYIKMKDAADCGGIPVTKSLEEWTGQAFQIADAVLFIGACGIAVRGIAPFVENKWNDPAVLVMDERANYCISLLSGHVGGGNELCELISQAAGAQAVITTATDVNQKFAVDMFAVKNGLSILNRTLAKEISADILKGKQIPMFLEADIFSEEIEYHLAQSGREELLTQGIRLILPGESITAGEEKNPGIYIGLHREKAPFAKTLYLIPKVFVLGIGCKRGTGAEDITGFLDKVCRENKIPYEALQAAASIDLKKEEAGIVEFCRKRKLKFLTYSAEELNLVEGNFHGSAFVKQTTGVDNVCERSAVRAAAEFGKDPQIIIEKTQTKGVTASVAKYKKTDWRTG